MSEVRLTTAPEALPGSCVQCGGVIDGKLRKVFLDTGRFQEFHGQVYYCDICCYLMMQLFGFISPEDAEGLRKQIAELEGQVYDLQVRNDALGRTVNGLSDAGFCADPAAHLHPAVVDRLPLDGVAEEGNKQAAGDAGEETSDGAGSLDSGAGAPDEPGDDEGVDDVRSDGGVPDFSIL